MNALGRGRRALAAVSLAVSLAACGDSEAAPQAEVQHADGRGAVALPSPHVHGVAVNPKDGTIYLATHDGLFRYEGATPTRVGPVIDLMGFSVAGPDHFYASGHPGEGADLPEPVGLIESTDGGRTWNQLSRQGESDFHALAASAGGVIGFDGALRATSDGKDWRELDAPTEPYALTVSPDGSVVLGTAPTGLIRSDDAGETWTSVADAPALMLVDWASGDVVAGVTADGTVALSRNGGLTWEERGSTVGRPQALGAAGGADGAGPDLVVATDSGIVRSSDGGATFRPYPEAS